MFIYKTPYNTSQIMGHRVLIATGLITNVNFNNNRTLLNVNIINRDIFKDEF